MARTTDNEQSGSGNLAILSKIDKLRELLGSTVGSKISLPQVCLVVALYNNVAKISSW